MGYKSYLDKNFGQEIVWNNLRLDEFDHMFLNGDAVLPSTAQLDAPNLEEELELFKPDVVLNYGYYHKVQKRLYNWASSKKVPIVYMTDAENRQKRKLWKSILKYFYLSWRFRKISYFFTIGDENESYYKTYGADPKKFIRMHHPIDIDFYKNAYEDRVTLRKDIRDRYDIPERDFVMSVVGKLVHWKNQSHLIDLLYDLESKGRKAHVIMLGSGAMMDELKEKAKGLKQSRVHFAGFVDPLQLPSFYAASDLYAHPASIEPHSLAISEAVYMGCPAIISDRCGSYGPDDDVQDGKNGYVYEFGNIAQLSQQVIKLMDDEVLRHNFSEYSHQIAVKFQERSHRGCIDELRSRMGF
ncbi:glycosyltransferase family 4 protein [Mucilaginibacter daejeonensis]|uniref:glycosyltransferase family 4 protein n=1 Tax=Mucilaginibacter daejeonensis TaxID=398049 RepID=UPI001D171096|nr:glycosyltransferase family 4 protein [Mucilaginibacter daejeonensis]UEG52653.1 glycosyltransferase family 4 protein [Mucilaginibacter daejeonensis]